MEKKGVNGKTEGRENLKFYVYIYVSTTNTYGYVRLGDNYQQGRMKPECY